MFAITILVSRFLFIVYILYFLAEGFFYVLAERGIMSADRRRMISKQRLVMSLMHINAYLILAYLPKTGGFDANVLITGGIGLGFFIISWFLSGKIYADSCPLLWNCVFFLMDTGLIMLQRINSQTAARQLMWFFVGLGVMLVIPLFLKLIPRFEKLEVVYLIAGFLFILSPFVLGEEKGGATNWIQFFSFTFQPSEIVKFLYVFYLASVFRKKQELPQLIFLAIVSAAFVCVLVAQKDLGGALIFFMTFMVMLYIATGNIWLFVAGFFGAGLASTVAYRIFAHIRVRVAAWQNPFADIAGGGYQIAQSLFAIGTWGVLGSGLTRGVPNIIPVVESDFIFAAICEEFGGIFAVGLICIMLVIFYRGVHVALRAERRYYSLLAAGFTSMLAFQSFLILGGVVKLIPLTGVTLPFISYGGSSIIVSMLMVGILQWVFSYYRGGDELE